MNKLRLIINSTNNFKIIDKKLKSTKKFNVQKIGNSLIVTNKMDHTVSNSSKEDVVSGFDNFKNISISQNTINFNGYHLTIKDGILFINGVKYGDEISISDDNELLEYSLEETSIISIEIVNSKSNLDIEDFSVISNYSRGF